MLEGPAGSCGQKAYIEMQKQWAWGLAWKGQPSGAQLGCLDPSCHSSGVARLEHPDQAAPMPGTAWQVLVLASETSRKYLRCLWESGLSLPLS